MSGSENRRKDDPDARWNQPKYKGKGRKDTKSWCRGKVGRAHAPEYRINHHLQVFRLVCRWQKSGEFTYWSSSQSPDGRQWICYHEVYCMVCGKILVRWPKSVECPDYPEDK